MTATIEQRLTAGRFIRNTWYMAGWAEELPEPGRLLARTILGEPVVMFRKADGKPVALEDRCPHRFAPLSMGKVLDGDRLQCPYHGLELDASGACVLNPHGSKNIPSRARVASWPLVEKHQALWIWMGDVEPDPARIPDFRVLDHVPELAGTKRDQIRIEADYKLIVDNLLDLSHTCYLHAGTLGNADTIDSSVDVTEDGDDLIVSRLARDAEVPGIMRFQWPGHPPRLDVFTRMRWMAPSYMNLLTGVTEPGKRWEEDGTGFHALHMLTPETERSTHYFFTAVRFGIRVTDDAQNREIQERIGKLRRHAFVNEDAPVIEAQQRIIDRARKPLDPVVLSIDVGTMRWRRAVERLMAAETPH